MYKDAIARYCTVAAIGWSVIIAALATWSYISLMHDAKELATIEARALLNKDIAARFWAAEHGGIYVEKSSKTPPNPFLAHVPERDIKLPSGKELTLMNPAYMLRQMMSDFETLYGAKGHITSLIHYRPETAPDAWETKALKAFEAGSMEIVNVSNINGQPYIRIMQPLYTAKSCLKCHGVQGYKEGDVRGGVSLSVPLSKYYEAKNETALNGSIAFLIAWLAGIMLLLFLRKRIVKSIEKGDS